MPWTAPNLLDRIFSAKPFDPTQYDSLGNFLSGYAGGREQRKKNETADDVNQMAEGDASSGVMAPPIKRSWLEETIKGVYLGKSMQDPLKYQQANLQNKMLAARGIGETLDNRQMSMEIQDMLDAKAKLHELNSQNLTDEQWLSQKPTGNRILDAEIFKMQNTALIRQQQKDDFSARKYVRDYQSKLFEAAPEDYWRFRATLDKDGNPTEATGKLQKELQPRIESLEARRAYISGKIPGGKQPASIALTDEIIKTESDARAADAAGNTSLATTLRDRATLLREQTKGQEVVTGYDDQGRPIIRMGKGVGTATVGTQSQGQQKLLRYENTVELLNHLDSVLKPEHLGAMGVTGEWIMDRGLSQLIPEVANRERIDARTALIAAREGLMKEISNDPRFSNLDREEISKALPSSGIFESLPDAKQRIESVRSLITNRGKVYAKGLGQDAPIWTLTADEIKAKYKEFQDSGGKKGIDKETALRALTRFH